MKTSIINGSEVSRLSVAIHLDTKSHNSSFTLTEIYTAQKRIKVLRDTLLSATRSVGDKH
ncbi:hypothetical protein GFA93_14500 [Escherichia coli]|nr:hypothetical protein [Escherichia coli]